MSKVRGFEKVSKEQYMKDFKNTFPIENGSVSEEEINDIIEAIYTLIKLPKRETKLSAGYDCYAPITFELKPQEEIKIPTGIKAYMADDEVLMLYNRSSNPKKKGLILANSVGVVDKDYYGNPDNDGHFMFAFYNIKEEDTVIKKGEAIGQAIFQKYLVTDNDNAEGERIGGFGSTSK